jgi:hypothetical protein
MRIDLEKEQVRVAAIRILDAVIAARHPRIRHTIDHDIARADVVRREHPSVSEVDGGQRSARTDVLQTGLEG